MNNFRKYLANKGLSSTTQGIYSKYVADLLLIFSDLVGYSYADLLEVMAFVQTKGFSKKYAQVVLCALKHYFDFLVNIGEIEQNPATYLHIKGKQKTIAIDLLKAAQLDDIYANYLATNDLRKRNKALLGLIVYQGLTRYELEQLLIKDIDFEKGILEINQSPKLNNRILPLQTQQFMFLFNYAKSLETSLLLSKKRLNNVMQCLLPQLQKQHPYLKSFSQIRQSRIAYWVKSEGLRKAQYLAGHKYVSSTQRYDSGDLELLQRQLQNLHPLR